jgi:hypothetical protein
MKFLLVAQKIIYVLDLSLMPLSEETYEDPDIDELKVQKKK